MAPVSVLPGRIRYELMSLIGREGICKHLEKELHSIEGVVSASANRRTGRLLVIFDADTVSDMMLAKRIENVLSSCSSCHCNAPEDRAVKRNETESFSSQLAGRLMVDLAAHTFLPKR
jgi:cation transport ATPase